MRYYATKTEVVVINPTEDILAETKSQSGIFGFNYKIEKAGKNKVLTIYNDDGTGPKRDLKTGQFVPNQVPSNGQAVASVAKLYGMEELSVL